MTYTEAVEKALNGDTTGFDFLYNSTKNNKQKRQSPKVGNWRHTDSMFYDYRLTSRIMPVEERKGMRCEQGFF